MRRIYLAIAKTDHEGFSVIKGFDDEEKADAFCAEATLYDQGKRYCPAMDAPDEEWHEFEEWQSAFYKGHPAGVDNAADEYCVLPVLMAEASALPQVPRRESSDLLSCKRWHEAEVVALGKLLADKNADDSPLALSMRKNFRCKITQHETFIKALAAVTT